MTLTTHLLAGAAIGAKISNPFAAFILGLISHYFLDSLPHFEYHFEDWESTKKRLLKRDFSKSNIKFYRIFIDIFVGMTLVFFLFLAKSKSISVGFGSLGGVLPDALTGFYFLLPKLFPKLQYPLEEFHESAHVSNSRLSNKKFPIWGKALLEITIWFLIIAFLF